MSKLKVTDVVKIVEAPKGGDDKVKGKTGEVIQIHRVSGKTFCHVKLESAAKDKKPVIVRHVLKWEIVEKSQSN